VTLLDFARIPIVSDSPQLKWVHNLKLCKFLKEWIDPQLTMSASLQQLQQHLAQINQGQAANPCIPLSENDKMVIFFWQVFTTNTILSPKNLQGLTSSIWQPLQYFHPTTGITYQDFLGIVINIIFTPSNKSTNIAFSLLQGFKCQSLNQGNQEFSDADIYVYRHPCQKYLQSKHKLTLIGHLREIDGAEDFKRTNDGLAKRTSAIKMGEALSRAGYSDISTGLILHRVLRESSKNQQFNTAAPQAADYQQLHQAYQLALQANQQPICSLETTKERLLQLGASIRSYSNSRVYSLNDVAQENGDELIDRLRSEDNYLSKIIDREQQQQSQQLKQQIFQQLEELATAQKEAFCLNALGYNDSQIALQQQVSPSTITRRRQRTIKQMLQISIEDENFEAVATAYQEVVQDYFITAIIHIQTSDPHQTDRLKAIIVAINQRWGLSLLSTAHLRKALIQLFQQEGLAS
jgi:DNA-binding NarL/FixJ family response regulator